MKIVVANNLHIKYAEIICETIKESSKVRGTGIAERTPDYVSKKIIKGDAIIAIHNDEFAGFCYIETWDNKEFVVNSGLIVHPNFRNQGLAKKIKKRILEYSKEKYPDAKIFGITTGLAVLKINYELGYQPVTFSELTTDEAFWNGCKTCKNYDVLMRTDKKMCLCTGMLYDPKYEKNIKTHQYNSKVLSRLKNIKQALFLKKNKK
ncbi:MAG: GNAT family N-acetyltransferase [Lutibacter sp.]|uniref:GNAT family N-acetyltransferase n=1 Tax=Lutibacter sp. TaxID=1925666 RepID=UPI00185654A8|nr:GNAT family N-acetyltransferase [Lutibacter sp.]MBT8316414.1 GNAT family N-acetyltransferase [Lutibacter sp.]NNJ57274.1 GNAT family N-acetyltransferase [Lutibacter sp.]